jgi:hypothetical protein
MLSLSVSCTLTGMIPEGIRQARPASVRVHVRPLGRLDEPPRLIPR